jgi:hypothetical protein
MKKFVQELLDMNTKYEIFNIYILTKDESLGAEASERIKIIDLEAANIRQFIRGESSSEAGNMALHGKNFNYLNGKG